MEAVAGAVLGAVTRSVASKLLAAVEKMRKESTDLEANIRDLKREFGMISATLKEQLSQTGQPTVVIVSLNEFSDVAHEIEDCLDRFLPCATCGGEKVKNKKKLRDEIADLRNKLNAAHRRRENYDVKIQASAGATSNVDHTTNQDMASSEVYGAVGMEEPTQELGELLVGGKASKLKVVSIVGFGGSGKTALAWAVYNSDKVKDQFPCRAWAVASKNKHDDTSKNKQEAQVLLTAILTKLLGAEAQPMPQEIGQLRQHIKHQLETKRCLIVIDDIKREIWAEIDHMFPEKETESRILVTTAVTSVARTCSFRGGHVYNMRPLSARHSKAYLDDKVFSKPSYSSPAYKIGLSAILNKCYGFPLALVSVATALQGCNLTPKECEDFGRNLSSCMHENKNDNFGKLLKVLMHNYNSLPENSHRTCLLYASLFPNNRPFSTNSLIRRLSAEGYIEGKNGCSDLQVAYDHLKELIDRNMIQPIDASNNSKVKTCRTHGIINQLMLHKSRSSNFIATYCNDKNRSVCRHLVIQNQSISTSGMGKPLRRPRSLTVFGSAEDAVYSDLTNCELLRVLDLKECHDFKEDNLKHIYKLLQLKYLTLGRSVSKVPHKMENLHCLETLDLRKTKIEALPVEVISLPHLAHLFGKIKIENVGSKRHKNFSLQTLAGVVVDNNSGFPELMVHMNKLTRVKIWCEITSTRGNYTQLSEAIQNFATDGADTPAGPRSLSLHLNEYSEDVMYYHPPSNPSTASRKLGYLTSLKLQGRPKDFPQFLMSLDGLEELCLTSCNLTGAVLSKLDTLECLVCLKLVQVHLGDFDINVGDFPSLQRLCLVVQDPKFPTIQQGALPNLTSIQLLCEGLIDLCDINIGLLPDLQEIALDSMVNPNTIQLWENEAKMHPNRPKVMLLKRVETGHSVKYVASCQLDNYCNCDTCAVDHMEIDFQRLALQPHTSSDQIQLGHKRPRPPHSP